jgi:hypothetical protein
MGMITVCLVADGTLAPGAPGAGSDADRHQAQSATSERELAEPEHTTYE